MGEEREEVCVCVCGQTDRCKKECRVESGAGGRRERERQREEGG